MDVRRLPLIYASLMMARGSDGTCNLDQQYSCRRAVRDDRLDVLPGGGECLEKPYVQFTYLCIVNNYLPSVDYCCCAISNSIYCCRYHQDWNQFRCLLDEDEVNSRSLNETIAAEAGIDVLTRLMHLSVSMVGLLMLLGIAGCCVLVAGVSCIRSRLQGRIVRMRGKKRTSASKGIVRFKDSHFLQRTCVRDHDSLSGLMHGLQVVPSPDHFPFSPNEEEISALNSPAFETYRDHTTQPTAPSLADILGHHQHLHQHQHQRHTRECCEGGTIREDNIAFTTSSPGGSTPRSDLPFTTSSPGIWPTAFHRDGKPECFHDGKVECFHAAVDFMHNSNLPPVRDSHDERQHDEFMTSLQRIPVEPT